MTLTHNSMFQPQSGGGDDERLAVVLSQYVDELDRGNAPDRSGLLAAHPELADRLNEYLDSLKWLRQAMHEIKSEECSTNAPEALPRGRIGDYQIVREIGRGGMGVVYEARQLSLERTVALKLLPFSGLFDQKQIARFRNEAQAAAALHHPNIVPVYAVGCENGVHFYSMQYIDGQPLGRVIAQLRGEGETDSASGLQAREIRPGNWQPRDIWDVPSTLDLARSPTPSTVEVGAPPLGRHTQSMQSARTRNYVRNVAQLMIQGAEALQHAHECGVIHRDIKPSNLIIDRNGKLWITDFGLARSAVGPDLTVTGDLLGTARYMSPEQAAGRMQLVDHRTDVYSLGITLFEVLTLQPAFPGSDHQALLQRVQNESPPSLRSLNPAVPYDLETIVLKAIAKSREDRYATAGEFAADLRRFLGGESPHATRPTVFDRALKWVGRHKTVAAASVSVLAIALLGVSLAAGLLAAKQRQTDAALERTRDLTRQLTQVVDHLGAGVSDELRDVPGAEAVRAKLLRDTLTCYEALRTSASDDSSLAVDAAKAAFKAAAVHEQLGAHPEALRLYRESRDRLQELLASQPASSSLLSDYALVNSSLGSFLARSGDLATALETLERAAHTQMELIDREPSKLAHRESLALTEVNLGMVMADLGRQQGAIAHYRDAIENLKAAARSGTANGLHKQHLATALHNLSGLIAAERPTEAERLAREASRVLRGVSGPAAEAELGLVLGNLANILASQDRLGEAVPVFAEAITIQEELVKRSPQRFALRADLASTYNNRGKRFLDQENLSAAESDLTRARELFAELVRQFPDVPAHHVGLATVLDNLATVWERDGRSQAAAEAWEEAVKVQAAACQFAPDVEDYRTQLSRHQANLQRILASLGKHQDGTPRDAATQRKQT